jgi:hypothetical protein
VSIGNAVRQFGFTGGPVIPDGSNVVVELCNNGAGGSLGLGGVTVIVESAK